MNLFPRLPGAVVAALLALPAFAGPGAHGPNGEHLDGPAQQSATSSAVPKLEAKSEEFELVAVLGGGELSILVDRFETNEPVLNARVEVESGPLKAVARFHADHGDYAIDDPAFVQALGQPGEHALVFTVAAGKDVDLLDGTLKVAAAMPAGDHDVLLTPGRLAAGGGALLLAGTALAFALRRRRPHGGLQ
jgi:hypothetical protein